MGRAEMRLGVKTCTNGTLCARAITEVLQTHPVFFRLPQLPDQYTDTILSLVIGSGSKFRANVVICGSNPDRNWGTARFESKAVLRPHHCEFTRVCANTFKEHTHSSPELQ